MNLFINDIPVRLLPSSEAVDVSHFNVIIDATAEPITLAKLLNRVLINHAKTEDLDYLLDELDHMIPRSMLTITVTVDNYQDTKKFLKKKFKIIKAAGGLVRKGEKILMIYRLKKWDLPKGKLEKGEKNKIAACREVEEECNIKVNLGEKICTTWHTYTMKKKMILKKTVWFTMDIVKDNKMTPQLEEDIEEVRWMTPKEVYHALHDSYKSIAFVFDTYYRKEKQMAAAARTDQSSE